MAARGIRDITDDVFSEFHDADYNHPSKNPQIVTKIENVELDGDDCMYIYVPMEGIPPSRFHKEIDTVRDAFKVAFPERTIIVGGHDLKFTTITKKQEFKNRLDGTLSEE